MAATAAAGRQSTGHIKWPHEIMHLIPYCNTGHIVNSYADNSSAFGFLPSGAVAIQPMHTPTPLPFIGDLVPLGGEKLLLAGDDETNIIVATFDRSGEVPRLIDNAVRLGPMPSSPVLMAPSVDRISIVDVNPGFTCVAATNACVGRDPPAVHIFPTDVPTTATRDIPQYGQRVVGVKWYDANTLFTAYEYGDILRWDVRCERPVSSVVLTTPVTEPMMAFVPGGDALFVTCGGVVATVDSRRATVTCTTSRDFEDDEYELHDNDFIIIAPNERTLLTRRLESPYCTLWEYDSGAGLRPIDNLVECDNAADVHCASFDGESGSALVALWHKQGIRRYDVPECCMGLPFEGPEAP